MPGALRAGDPLQVGPYRLVGRLGGGGMGQVFLGRSPGGRLVAVKLVRPELAGDPGFRRRFAAEVRAARAVGGFYTAQVVASDPGAERPWLATAYIPGPSLHEAVEEHGPLPGASVALLGSGLAEGLAAVHASGLVHRDLKPGNVILAADGPRIIDFGIARALESTVLTQTHTVLGSVGFMSPEQARGGEVGPTSDVFSLGCVLVFAATGRGPFGTGRLDALAYRVVHEGPELAGLPADLAGAVAPCLAKDPAARPSLEEVLASLSGLVPAAAERGAGRWLPEAVTEVIADRETLRVTTAEPPGAAAGGGAPAPEPAPAPGTDGAAPDRARVTVGNLSTGRLDVLCDGAVLGTIDAGASRTFHVSPGAHSLQARAGAHRSEARQLRARPGSSFRLAFDIPGGHVDTRPMRVTSVTFTGSRVRRWWRTTLVTTLSFTLLFGWLVAAATAEERAGLGAGESLLGIGGFLLAVAPPSLVLGLAYGLVGLLLPPRRLTLGRDGLLLRSGRGGREVSIGWAELDQVSVVGGGRGAVLVAWYGRPPGGARSRVRRFRLASVGVTGGRELGRLRAALRWFASDVYQGRPE
ncbi:serine/threonine-protein kinase [Marinitenerispora sediminis]|uniref:serine/threonine-protein kinase n=1 Tax=Marinitenerispora sediminis TaxID=1931232 RepID=UPI0018F116C9|nr:serine/threonine-protein kinase [Marinitenerispora sediminis]